MSEEELKKIIIEEIIDVAPDVEEDEITMDDNIQKSLEIDSYDFLNILVALNVRVGVDVPEADYSKVDTLKNMIKYFSKRIK